MSRQRSFVSTVVCAAVALVVLWWVATPSKHAPIHGGLAHAGRSAADTFEGVRDRVLQDLPRPADGAENLRHLVIVPCHGIVRGSDFTRYKDDDAWAFEPYQRGHRLPEALAAHIQQGISIAEEDPTAVVVFSGGQTRTDAGARSEAQSYLDLAIANEFPGAKALLGDTKPPSGSADEAPATTPKGRRLFVDDFARDSYENVIFSIARFAEITGGALPSRITVVGFAYKERRFLELHRHAIRFPTAKFNYVGIDEKPPASPEAHDVATNRPLSDAKTMARVRQDLYMCRLGLATRRKRNPNRRAVPYYLTAPAELRALMLHCGPELFAGPLPWDVDATEPAALPS